MINMKIMKKKLFFCALLFMTVILSGCQNEETYSCNQEIDEWVHDNLNEIRAMSRSTWNDLDESVKRATFRAFTQQQKINFWKDKLNEVLQMEWNDEEKAHIAIILNYIDENPQIFDRTKERTDEEQEEIDIFFYKWVEDAKAQLNWDMPLITGIVATGNTLVDKSGKIRISTQSRALVKSSGEECDCEIDQYMRWCLTMDCETSRTGCKASEDGCGFFWDYPCDGTCGGV
ncbi:hypothetical protein C802_01052 [Phocaeicola sartorii]|uniref:Bacteriocin fulvocin C-related protein n=2 Tax=Phocaeicola sartorii TaxID=671267 RepID=R9IC06_9BACT|nr:hypothetical protein C802_01052 [Phocaeicola sartorii]